MIGAELDDLTAYPARLDPIYETVRKVKAAASPGKTLIGFAGSPWTVATYMVAGQGSRDQAEARRLAYADPAQFGEIIARIEAVTLDYLSGQVEAGAEALQLFDSWAGSLSPAQFEQWVIAPTARLVAALDKRHPDVPVIGFPEGRWREARRLCARDRRQRDRARRDGRSAYGRRKSCRRTLPVQGNLDPLALIAGGKALEGAVEAHP